MPNLVKIELDPPQGMAQKGLHQMIHAAMTLMHHLKAKGQSAKFHYDDGTVVSYVPSGVADNAAGGAEITMTPGVV